MKATDDVFKLIRSLSQSEKRFFKLSTRLESRDRNYLKLFDAIDKQRQYDEKKLKDKFKGEGFIRNFAKEKLILQRQIMRTLRAFHSTSSHDIELNNMLTDIEIYADRRLFKPCLALIEKAKRRAREGDLFLQLLQITKWEYRCWLRMSDFEKISSYEGRLFTDEIQWLMQYENFLLYRKSQSKMFPLLQTKVILKDSEKKKLARDLFKEDILKSKRYAKSFLAKVMYHDVRGNLFRLMFKMKESINEAKQVVDLYKRHPERIAVQPQPYFSALNNLSSRLINEYDHEPALYFTAEMEKIPAICKHRISKSLKKDIVTCCAEKRLISYCKQYSFDKATRYFAEVEYLLSGDDMRKDFETILLFFGAYAYFGKGDLKKAQRLLNRLLNSKNTARLDLVSSAHIMNLSLNYVKGNIEGLTSLVKRARREITSPALLNEVDFFSHLTKQSFKTAFGKLRVKLDRIPAESPEAALLENFEMQAWAESILQGISFEKAMQAKRELNRRKALK